ncbi:MAG TPA: hypothetical protein VJH95_01975 [Candidatus Nanoarchaeia archaeon]|nr:hypothetical protein [Candidatus Nanoarchaeia archaeon]
MKARITTWYHNKDVAFAIGVDELPMGGSHHSGPKNEYWDTFYWYRKENNFWSKYWKPILDQNPWIKYSLGWVPCHTSFLTTHAYEEPKEINPSELSWETATGKAWIEQVMKPIFQYGNKHYDAYTFHGYYHELPFSYYYPYWSQQPINPSPPYSNPRFFDSMLKSTQQAFNYAWHHNALTLNTFPFGGGRPDAPAYLSRNGVYATGFWLDMKNVTSIDENSGLKNTRQGIKTYKLQLGEEIEPEGTSYNGKSTCKAVVGNMGYWHQDKELFKLKGCPLKPAENDSIIGVPYSLSIEGTTRNFKSRVRTMMSSHKNYDSPVLYYFMHAQMDWIDSLGGSSITHIIRNFLEELKIPFLNRLTFSKKPVKQSLSIALLLLALSTILFKSAALLCLLLSLIFLIAFSMVKVYGLNACKHNNQMQWLNDNYGDRIWATDFSTLAEYFDIRKRAVISEKPRLRFAIDTSLCFQWNREIPITFEILGIKSKVKGYYIIKNRKKVAFFKGFSQDNEKVTINDISICPNKQKTEFGLIL